jgi:SYF2 splicing factor
MDPDRLSNLRARAESSRTLCRAAQREEEKRSRGQGAIGGRRARARRAQARALAEQQTTQETAQNATDSASLSMNTAAAGGLRHVDLDAARRDDEEWESAREREDETLKKLGLDPALERAIRVPASQAERADDNKARRMRKRARNEAGAGGFGWSAYNPDTHFAVHKKRVADAGLDREARQRRKRSQPDDQKGEEEQQQHGFLGDVSAVRPENVDRMVAELDRAVKRRKNFIRSGDKRAGTGIREGGDFVDFINERNAVFNNKTSRSFDQYTQELKANLERGTAV